MGFAIRGTKTINKPKRTDDEFFFFLDAEYVFDWDSWHIQTIFMFIKRTVELADRQVQSVGSLQKYLIASQSAANVENRQVSKFFSGKRSITNYIFFIEDIPLC